jgi:hypothetical protein
MATKMADDQQQQQQRRRRYQDPPGAIQRLVKSLVQQHRHDRQEDNKPSSSNDEDHHEDDGSNATQKKKKGNASRCGGCYQIVVESTKRAEQQEEDFPRDDRPVVEAFAAAFQSHAGCQVLRIQTLPSTTSRSRRTTNNWPIATSAAPDKRCEQPQRKEEDESPAAARTNYSRCETWKQELLGEIQEIGTSTAPTSKTGSSTLVVKVLDSVIPIMYHCGGGHSNDPWQETLTILRRLRQSCHVLLIHVDVGANNANGALSRRQIQALETTSSALVYDDVLLRRGVHEYDQWLREDLLLRRRDIGIGIVDHDDIDDETKPPVLSHNKNGGVVFYSPRNDPDVVQFHQADRGSVDDDDDEEDPDDDLDI